MHSCYRVQCHFSPFPFSTSSLSLYFSLLSPPSPSSPLYPPDVICFHLFHLGTKSKVHFAVSGNLRDRHLVYLNIFSPSTLTTIQPTSTPIQTFPFHSLTPPPPLFSCSCCNGALSPYPTHEHCFSTYRFLQESERPRDTLFMFINEIYSVSSAKTSAGAYPLVLLLCERYCVRRQVRSKSD